MLGILYPVFSEFTLDGPASRPRLAGKFSQFATSPLDAYDKRCQMIRHVQPQSDTCLARSTSWTASSSRVTASRCEMTAVVMLAMMALTVAAGFCGIE